MNVSRYLFGAYRFEPEKGLFRGDSEVQLPPKELQLLQLLLSLEGRVASRNLIESELWPRQVVTYSSLSRCVYSLRKCLDSEGETYIQTVPKRGFRLVAPLKKEPVDHASTNAGGTADTTPLAYAHFLQGQREANNPCLSSAERAIHWYQEALTVDPGFAAVYSAIADLRIVQVVRGFVIPAEGLELARSACEQALRLDPSAVAARVTQAYILGLLEGSPLEGLVQLDEALSHDPDYALAYTYRSLLLRTLGRFEEALQAIRHAVELDPHLVMNRHALAWSLFCFGHAEEALKIERDIHIAYPEDDIPFFYQSVFLVHLDRHEEAVEAAFEALRLSGGIPSVQAAVAYVFAKVGDEEEARELVRQAESATLPRAPRMYLATAYLALGDRARALDLLEQARAEHCVRLPAARVDPRLAPLANEPRFLALFQ